MLSRPSSRRRSGSEELNINLVPMLDALVTIVAFLLLSTAFVSIATIDTPVPSLAAAPAQLEKIEKNPPLQLTVYVQPEQILISDWTGSREKHTVPSIEPTKYDIEQLHQKLIEIKGRHPTEKQVILKPDSGVSYENIVAIIDAARSLEKTDPPILKPATNGEAATQINELFPEVIFGNILAQ